MERQPVSPIAHGNDEEPERDTIDDDDGLDEMVIDPPIAPQNFQDTGSSLDASMLPPPPPLPTSALQNPNAAYQWNPQTQPWYPPQQPQQPAFSAPATSSVAFQGGFLANEGARPAQPLASTASPSGAGSSTSRFNPTESSDQQAHSDELAALIRPYGRRGEGDSSSSSPDTL